jgi:hypothetical protein
MCVCVSLFNTPDTRVWCGVAPRWAATERCPVQRRPSVALQPSLQRLSPPRPTTMSLASGPRGLLAPCPRSWCHPLALLDAWGRRPQRCVCVCGRSHVCMCVCCVRVYVAAPPLHSLCFPASPPPPPAASLAPRLFRSVLDLVQDSTYVRADEVCVGKLLLHTKGTPVINSCAIVRWCAWQGAEADLSPRTDGDADGIDLPTMFLDPTVVQSMKAGPTVGNLPQVALSTYSRPLCLHWQRPVHPTCQHLRAVFGWRLLQSFAVFLPP